MFFAESTPLGLDSTWWTALGTLVALLVALGGAFFPALAKRLRKPSLSLQISRAKEFSSTIDNAYWLRVPVANAEHKDEAKNVEVFLEAFVTITDGGRSPTVGFVPMRLKWCNTDQPSCPSIPAGSFRLLDLGAIETQARVQKQSGTLLVNFPEFRLAGEQSVDAHRPLATGTYELSLSISCEGTRTFIQHVRLELNPGNKNAPAIVSKAPRVRAWNGEES